MSRHAERGSVLITVVLALSVLAATAVLLSMRQGMQASRTALRQENAVARHVAEAGVRDALAQARAGNFPGTFSRPFTDLGSYVAQVTLDAASPSWINITSTGTTANGSKAVASGRYELLCINGIKSPSLFTTYQSAGKPITIFQTATGNNAAEHLAIDHNPDISNSTRAIVAFDLSAIPKNSTIRSATLLLDQEMHDPTMAGGTLYVNRITRSWNSSQANWTHYDAGSNKKWDSTATVGGGGDFDALYEAHATIQPAATVTYSWDLTEMVRSWNGGSANYGIIIRTNRKSVDSNHAFRLKSNKDVWPASQWPRLEVEWC